MTKPLYKWTGGKGRLLKKYTNLGFFPDPSQFDTFVDLFFGAGAVTCWVADMYPDKNLIINDLNEDMMFMMLQMRNNWTAFRAAFVSLSNLFLDTPQDERKARYNEYKVRYALDPGSFSDSELAACLLVLLKTNFNGIWRQYIKYGNRYSTPPGHVNYKPTLFDITAVEAFRDVLCRATVYNLSFEDVPIPERSWVFADPPYRDTDKGMYSDQFNDELQARLAAFLQEHSCLFAESNKDTGDGFWQGLFSDTQLHFLDHKYTCGQGGAVNPVTEVLIKNYGEPIQEGTLEHFF